MAAENSFVAEILLLFTPLGEVRAKPMFGGYGIFLGGTMFALISSRDQLFVKADEENRAALVERGGRSHGKMPYYSVPGEALNGWSEMAVWAEGAVEAACRGKKGKQGGKAER